MNRLNGRFALIPVVQTSGAVPPERSFAGVYPLAGLGGKLSGSFRVINEISSHSTFCVGVAIFCILTFLRLPLRAF